MAVEVSKIQDYAIIGNGRFVNGWIFSLLYVATFQILHQATWWFGALIGFVHATFILAVALPALPALHPRIANEQYGPTVAR
jgi:uncharacterized membrane protein YagU involved in acid resistance